MEDAREKTPTLRQFTAKWGDAQTLPQAFVDEMQCQIVNDRAYLTFGQITMPLDPNKEGGEVQIVPQTRLIITLASLRRMIDVLKGLDIPEK